MTDSVAGRYRTGISLLSGVKLHPDLSRLNRSEGERTENTKLGNIAGRRRPPPRPVCPTTPARRRVTPIPITAFTTSAGLFSLATGLGGRSLIWGAVATAIVWGLGFSTLLNLFVIPLL